ncbi:MAG: serine/threonine-protein kinase, partial [Planctomycetota bacterium]
LGVARTAAEIVLEKQLLAKEQVEKIESALRSSLPPEKIGGFEVMDKIGRGAMATVYRARQTSLQKIVALKVLHQFLGKHPRFVKQFIQEGRAVGRLNHPHVVHAIDAGEENGYYYLAMEFVDGETLRKFIERRGKLPEKEVCHITRAVAQGLGNAHKNGLLHRDLKPDNILLGKEGQIKLGDLGLAVPLDDVELLAEEHKRMGTPFYLSPEQAQGREIDARSDLYSLGATLYHALCGRPPFSGKTVKEILSKQVHQAPVPLREREPSVSPPTEAWVMRLLEKDPADRPQSVAQFLEELDAAELQPGAPAQRISRGASAPRRAGGTAPRKGKGRMNEEFVATTGTIPRSYAGRRRFLFTLSGASVGGLLALVFLGMALANQKPKTAPGLFETRSQERREQRINEIIQRRIQQWKDDVQQLDERVKTRLAKVDRDAKNDKIRLRSFWQLLRNQPHSASAPLVVERIDKIRSLIEEQQMEGAEEFLSKARKLEEEGRLWGACEVLEGAPRNIRKQEDIEAIFEEMLTVLEKKIDNTWKSDCKRVEKLKEKREFDEALQILDHVSFYADDETIKDAMMFKGEIVEAKAVFVKLEHAKRLSEETRIYRDFVKEYQQACNERRFKDCISKALTLQVEMTTEEVRAQLENDLQAFQILFKFEKDAAVYLKSLVGTDEVVHVRMKNKDKFSGSVQSVESDRLWLTLKRGRGEATIPLKLAEFSDQTVFELVAAIHGEKRAGYLIPLGVLFTYRGQLDLARQHFDLATERGISTDPWLKKMEWMRKNRPQ